MNGLIREAIDLLIEREAGGEELAGAGDDDSPEARPDPEIPGQLGIMYPFGAPPAVAPC